MPGVPTRTETVSKHNKTGLIRALFLIITVDDFSGNLDLCDAAVHGFLFNISVGFGLIDFLFIYKQPFGAVDESDFSQG